MKTAPLIISLKKSIIYFFKKVKIIVDKEIKFDIIEMHVENAAVVQRLVHLIAIQMMTVRFRSVAPYENNNFDTTNIKVFSFLGIKTALLF